jgi:DNA repair protein RadD
MYQIRYYQEQAVQALLYFLWHMAGNPLVAMPTGTGKSVVIAEFLRSIYTFFPELNLRVIMATHVKELIEQNYEEMTDMWPLAPAGIYSAGLGKKEIRPITFGGIASMVKKAADFGFVHFVIIDEAHLVSPHDETSYQNFIADLKKINPNLRVIGLTATPYRVGQGLLTNPIETSSGMRPSIFTDICFDITGFDAFNKLLDEGFMCRLEPKRTDEKLDVSEVSIKMGEFKLDELQLAVDREEITRRAIDEMITKSAARPHSSGRPRCRWLVFGTGMQHCDHIAAELVARGIEARVVTAKTPKDPRKAAVKWIKEDTEDIRCLVNNGVFTTGFNCKQLDVIGILRPTNSTPLWVQLLGRGTRPFEGKDDCLVFDFAGNTKRLGPINDPVIPKRKGQGGSGEAPVKICEQCDSYCHASVRFCPCCKWEFPKAIKIQERASSDELIKGDKPQIEIFRVTHVEYDVYRPKDESKPASMRVVYWCGKIQKFSQYLNFEHGGYAAERARTWWRRATKLESPMPASTEEAVTRAIKELDQPTHIRVWVHPRNSRVQDEDYSGTAFGTAESSGLPEKLAV